jgi:hypothetical protein
MYSKNRASSKNTLFNFNCWVWATLATSTQGSKPKNSRPKTWQHVCFANTWTYHKGIRVLVDSRADSPISHPSSDSLRLGIDDHGRRQREGLQLALGADGVVIGFK